MDQYTSSNTSSNTANHLPSIVITGAHDGKIRVWNQDTCIQQLSLVTETSATVGNNSPNAVNAASESPHQGRISGLVIDERTRLAC